MLIRAAITIDLILMVGCLRWARIQFYFTVSEGNRKWEGSSNVATKGLSIPPTEHSKFLGMVDNAVVSLLKKKKNTLRI